jgi:hypothetical protein
MYKPKKIHTVKDGEYAVGETVKTDCGKFLSFVPLDCLERGHAHGQICEKCPQGTDRIQVVEYL